MTIAKPVADFRTIPDGDYRKEWALLVGEVHAAIEEGFTSVSQQQAFGELQQSIEHIRNLDDKRNKRGLLAHYIEKARHEFRAVMGEQWTPSATNTVAKAARARHLTI